MGGRIGQSGCWSTRRSRQVHAFVHSGGRSLLQQLLQAIQVALNEIGIGVVVFVCDAWLAKEWEKQLAAASIGDQSHGDVDLRSRRSNDRVIQNTILVPTGSACGKSSRVSTKFDHPACLAIRYQSSSDCSASG